MCACCLRLCDIVALSVSCSLCLFVIILMCLMDVFRYGIGGSLLSGCSCCLFYSGVLFLFWYYAVLFLYYLTLLWMRLCLLMWFAIFLFFFRYLAFFGGAISTLAREVFEYLCVFYILIVAMVFSHYMSYVSVVCGCFSRFFLSLR